MSEYYIKAVDPGGLTEQTQMLRVNISSFKGRADVELTAEYDGEIIGKTRFNLNIGENIIELFIKELTEPRKIIFKLFHKGTQKYYHEADIGPHV